ncbi:hypothetical protein [Aureimonas populi]|uniref:PetM family of cytochrome b6f complex subunit 7 n=1 Tax=Aureimonas populi TaxID=1701758 RepID=A0ABW5CN51_9HYPH|nr:hypothetical protein [Aureimonas populi]
MIAFLFRLIGCFVLAAGTVFATGDVARSLSAERLRMTSVAEGWELLAGAPLSAPPGLAANLAALVAAWPMAPTLAALAVLLLLLGRRRASPARLAR